MPGQFLPLRLLGSSSALLVSPRRGITVLTRAFPFKLKYAALSPGQPAPVPNWAAGAPPRGARPFSGRSAGGRGGGGLRDSRRGGFRGAAGQGRSLVDDEAELSNWVSDLKTDSFRFGSSSDGEDAGSYARGKAKGRERGRGRDGYRGRGRDGRSSFGARFGSESDDAGEFAGGRTGSGGRSRGRGGDRGRIGERRDRGREPMPSSRGYGMSSVGERDSDSGDSNSFLERRRGRGSDRPLAGSRGSRSREPMPSRRGYGMSSVGERDSDSGDFNSFSERRRGRGSDRPLRGSREMVSGSDLNGKVEDVDFGGRKRGRGGIGGMTSPSSLAKRGRKGSEPSGSRSGGGRLSFEISDEQESEDDDDDDDEEEEEEEEDEDEDVSVSEDGFFGKVEDRGERVVPDAYDRMSLSKEKGDAPSRPSTSEGAESYLSQTRFDQCSVSPLSLKGIKAAGYERMTMVQEATLPIILKGNDVLAKAKTGTGKTVAFLLPAIEVITKSPPVDRDQKRPPIIVLVICPTRELANQAATEANTLLKFHPSIGVQVVIGGTRLALEQKNMQANPCQILVATPGRLKDHIENTPGFATRLKGVKVLVLDEADHLLDMGFRKDIENIIAAVPKQRQTLLFSATVPDEVRQICHIALKRDHEFVNTVEDGSEETHSQVKQWVLVAPLEKHFSMLYGILTDHISENIDYKVLVFCTTAMVTRLVAGLLAELNLNVREIHSRKPQSYRTRVSDEFRKSKGLILVTSDVSARGVDYPDVTLVIQVGVPADREQYIHRLGRTGRKGKEGKGILLLAPWEESFLSGIKDLPISEAPVPLVDPDTRKKVERALSHVEMKNKESAYQSWLGYYNSNKSIGRDKARLVVLANEFSRSMGLDDPPALSKLVVGKMGLRNVPGLRTK